MKDRLSDLYQEVLRDVGALEAEPDFLDVKNTPGRVARMLRSELLSSYQKGALEELKKRFTTFPAEMKRNPQGPPPIVSLAKIPFSSTCAHHMLPFFGEVSVAYVPVKTVVGLSKIPRVVEFFSRKLQMQERLTEEIADFLTTNLKPYGLIVLVSARHLCMELRGVRSPGVVTTTSAIRGKATNGVIREEMYRLLLGKA